MSYSTGFVNESKLATVARKKDRIAVQAGRARWLLERPRSVEVIQPTTPPVKHERRPFGEGLGERNPVYRSPVALSDLAWWEAENARDEDREIARMEERFIAQGRLDSGLDVY